MSREIFLKQRRYYEIRQLDDTSFRLFCLFFALFSPYICTFSTCDGAAQQLCMTKEYLPAMHAWQVFFSRIFVKNA